MTCIRLRRKRKYLNCSHAAIKISINATAAGFICKNIFPTPVQIKNFIKIKSVTYSKYTYIRMFVNKFSAMLTNFHLPFHSVQIYFILFNIYYDFLQVILHPLSLPACPLFERRNSVIVRPPSIIFAPKPRIYYQNICILPRKIPMNIQITYFRT